MATVRVEEIIIPAARLGDENPHAPLILPWTMFARYQGEDMLYTSCLPYRLQDEYDRELRPRAFRAVVLESDRLVATVLPEIGGRLWSLRHKPTGRELLHVNAAWQPANLGLRNAWVSGGVEWNPGVYGHTMHGNDPVFAHELRGKGGEVGVRLSEYERMRRVPWQVDLWLRDGDDQLWIVPQLQNPHDETIPMYWWTCIATTERSGTRVLASTDRAVEPDHVGGPGENVVNLAEDGDRTRPANRYDPKDTYYDIPDGRTPWIAAIEEDGAGTVHFSEERLIGRKLWVWGTSPNGRRWQEWLAQGGEPYIEIQGGLARKQNEYVPMPPGAVWSWTEAIGYVDGVTASDWTVACEAVTAQLPAYPSMDGKVVAEVAAGSGWGSLEVDPRTSTDDTEPWRTLALTGEMPAGDPSEAPGAYMVDPKWQGRLERATPNWLTWLHLGVMRFANGDPAGARSAWESSVAATPNGWAERNLAVLLWQAGDPAFVEHLRRAVALLPHQGQLADEACRLLLAAGQLDALEELLPNLPARPRVRLARAQLALLRGDAAAVRQYFAEPFDLVDIRESETVLSDLWRGLCRIDPSAGDPNSPPRDYDFRMFAAG